MTDLDGELLKLFTDEAGTRDDAEQIRAIREADLRTTFEVAQSLGIETPPGIDLATLTASQIEASLWSEEPFSPENIYIYMGNTASEALGHVRSGSPEEVVEIVMMLVGEELLPAEEKLKWVKVVEAITDQVVVSRIDRDTEAELRIISEMSEVQAAKELAAARNGILKAEVAIDLSSVLIALYGPHDDQRVLLSAIMKCAEAGIIDESEAQEDKDKIFTHYQRIALAEAELRGVSERDIDTLIVSTKQVLEDRGYPLT